MGPLDGLGVDVRAGDLVELAGEVDAGSSVQIALRQATNSSARAPRRSNGAPAASYSCFDQPSPRPRSRRPPDTASRVAVCLASRIGENHGMFRTATPSRIRLVWAAR